MCGRYTVLTEDEIIEIREVLKRLSVRIVRDDFVDYSAEPGEVRPTNHAPVITKKDTGVSFERVKWGFKKWNSAGVIINARCETIKITGMFSKLIQAGRCVVPAGEFFEWEKVADGTKKYFVKDKDGNLLFMAGLYRETEEGREFVIITKKSTPELDTIHNRMPAILRADQIEGWLSGVLTPEDLEKLTAETLIHPAEEDQ